LAKSSTVGQEARSSTKVDAARTAKQQVKGHRTRGSEIPDQGWPADTLLQFARRTTDCTNLAIAWLRTAPDEQILPPACPAGAVVCEAIRDETLPADSGNCRLVQTKGVEVNNVRAKLIEQLGGCRQELRRCRINAHGR
jgi:hypothetical protein